MSFLLSFIVIFPFVGALLAWLAGTVGKKRSLREPAAAVAVVLQFLAVCLLYLQSKGAAEGAAAFAEVSWDGFCGVGLAFEADAFRRLYVLVSAFAWLVSTLFSFSYMKHYENKNRYYFFLLLTLGATEGVFLSADLFTMFVFFELMSFASYVWVAQDERKESLRAGETYLAIAVMGGLCILMGMFLLSGETGTLRISELGPALFAGAENGRVAAAGVLMLLGFGAKAGAFPLHIWLPKAHPVAPAPASALLSGILTKTGVFGVMILTLKLFSGNVRFGALIFVLGILTMAVGALLAVFSVDLKRTLACSSVSQIGFILIGLGVSGMANGAEDALSEEVYELGISGFTLHMVNHSLIKLLLFCAAGVVFMNLHKLDLNEIRGYGRRKPFLKALFLIGALGIAGVPLFNGYVSKSLIHEALAVWQELHPQAWMKISEWLFIICGGLTASYMTKLYVCIFAEKNRNEALQAEYDTKKRYMTPLAAMLLTVTAALLPAIGIYAGITREMFGLKTIGEALLSLVIGAAVYLFFVRTVLVKDGEYRNCLSPKLDLEENFYRPLIGLVGLCACIVCRILDRLPDYLVLGLRKTWYRDTHLPHELEEGNAVTHAVGGALDRGRGVLNRTVCKKRPIRVSLEHKLAMFAEEMRESNTMIARSLSFGLLLFCIGLVFTLIYLLVVSQ